MPLDKNAGYPGLDSEAGETVAERRTSKALRFRRSTYARPVEEP